MSTIQRSGVWMRVMSGTWEFSASFYSFPLSFFSVLTLMTWLCKRGEQPFLPSQVTWRKLKDFHLWYSKVASIFLTRGVLCKNWENVAQKLELGKIFFLMGQSKKSASHLWIFDRWNKYLPFLLFLPYFYLSFIFTSGGGLAGVNLHLIFHFTKQLRPTQNFDFLLILLQNIFLKQDDKKCASCTPGFCLASKNSMLYLLLVLPHLIRNLEIQKIYIHTNTISCFI